MKLLKYISVIVVICFLLSGCNAILIRALDVSSLMANMIYIKDALTEEEAEETECVGTPC